MKTHLRGFVRGLSMCACALALSCGGGSTNTATTASDGATTDATSTASDGATNSDSATSSDGTTTSDAPSDLGDASDSRADLPIGEWTDAPGSCPAGIPRVDITTSSQLASAARGEDAYTGDPASVCYFIHDGNYRQDPAILYIRKGGTSDAARRWFVGQSRAGVVIHGRGGLDTGIGNVTITNLTFDLTGYAGTGAFNTFDLGTAQFVTVDHVTFTGDCNTGLQGGHMETNGVTDVLIDSCLVEKFGHCSGGGHLDHGIYLASGKRITIRNSVIRGNSSRGIQMFTNSGAYGTLDTIVVEQSRIYQNGHADYEDGIVINAAGTGPISNVTFRRNLIYGNYYSGVRFAGGIESAVTFDHNTFFHNGAGSSSASRSEVNIDAAGGGAGTTFSSNIFDVGNVLINDCYDGASKGFHLGGDFVHGAVPSGAACVGSETTGDPMFVSSSTGDFHTSNPAVAAFGAYGR